ncbi:hypothetical protein BRARA_C02173 [Brassica rapa]|uniref:Defensin-like domain-containing protein n=2 Tax=Brassica TaxID=3705 RepID=A0ABQ8DUJ0_BRANA|nr:hypothetical protein HID58_010174 [Brassica napus]RID70128.1 hypothetical protein BRARA_C02173 [Brassica rapa]
MGIGKTSIAIFFVVILTISISNHNVSAVTVIEKATPPPCLFLCNGFPLNNFACWRDCGLKGYYDGRCGGNPSRCCCRN